MNFILAGDKGSASEEEIYEDAVTGEEEKTHANALDQPKLG